MRLRKPQRDDLFRRRWRGFRRTAVRPGGSVGHGLCRLHTTSSWRASRRPNAWLSYSTIRSEPRSPRSPPCSVRQPRQPKVGQPRRRRVHAIEPTEIETNPVTQHDAVDAFFAASRSGDLDALLALLHPEVTFQADGGTSRPAATATVHGPQNVTRRATTFAVPEATFESITVNGTAAVVVRAHQQPVSIMALVISHDRIVQIYSLLDQPRIEKLINDLT